MDGESGSGSGSGSGSESESESESESKEEYEIENVNSESESNQNIKSNGPASKNVVHRILRSINRRRGVLIGVAVIFLRAASRRRFALDSSTTLSRRRKSGHLTLREKTYNGLHSMIVQQSPFQLSIKQTKTHVKKKGSRR